MNRDPFRQPTKALVVPGMALVLAACSGSSEDVSPPISTPPTVETLTPLPPGSQLGVVFCDRRPGEGTPSTGPGESTYFFMTGNAENPGRNLATMYVAFGTDASSGAIRLHYEWDFPDDLPQPSHVKERTSITFNNITYAMGVTATVQDDMGRVYGFCAPEGDPSIPSPPVTVPAPTT